jgi:CheY-like chemotaxis protein
MAMKEIPDVIITDYHMPEGSGQYLVGRLKGTPLLKDIPVIMLTGASIGNSRDFALERRFLGEYGASAFLSKPVDLDVLLGALSEHIAIDPEVMRTASKLRRR